MKKTFLVLGILINCNLLFAHKEWVHQYIVWESYTFMQQELQYGYQDLRDHIGFGFFGHGPNDDIWSTGLIGIGAYREDMEDPVYGYDNIFNGWDPTVTHFWDGDRGDNSKTTVSFYGDVENAWTKARVYLFGGQKIFFEKRSSVGCCFPILGRLYKYNSLIDFFTTGNCTYEGFIDLAGNHGNEYGGPIQLVIDENSRKKYAYMILGRIAHLLADVGTPAHTLNDEHPCGFFGERDEYELKMGDNLISGCDDPHSTFFAQNFNSTGAANQGSIISEIQNMSDYDAMRYLFYTSNQIANFFPTDDFHGNTNLQNGTNSYIATRYAALGNPPFTVNSTDIANEAFLFTIRATASLFDWFARKTNQQRVYVILPTVGSITCNLPYPQNIYWNESATFSATVSGPGPIYYQWTIGKCGLFTTYCDWFGIEFPPGLSVSNPQNSTFVISNSNYQTRNCGWPDPLIYTCGNPNQNIWMKVRLKVTNPYGSVTKDFSTSPIAAHRPYIPPPPPGCPYIYVFNNDSTYWVADNNILHRSEFTEFSGQTIEDLYLLRVKPGIIDGKVSIYIKENESNNNIFDEIKMYAVDHPIGTLVGVTEDNEIVLYDGISVQSSDDAALNDLDVTEIIQYDYNGEKIVLGNEDDSVFAHFESQGQLNAINYFNEKHNVNSRSSSNLALIGNVSSNPNADADLDRKRKGAFLDIFINGANYTTSFARRELSRTCFNST